MNLLFSAAELLLFIRVIISWFRYEDENQFTRWLCRTVDPALAPIRRILPRNSFGVDFSPIILFLLIDILKRLLFTL
ncbi:MAG: YggT family protein [Fibrobacterota bacterium]